MPSFKASKDPLITVTGVLNSWDILAINSFFILSSFIAFSFVL